MSPSHRHDEDAALVALIDGEADAAERTRLEKLIAADPVVADRFDMLSRTNLDFAGAFRPMLEEAPLTRLQAGLAAMAAPSAPVLAPAAVAAAAGGRPWNRREMLAAGLALFVAGSLVPHFVPGLLPVPKSDAVPDEDHGDDWRAAVAAYLDLYTADTLANLPDDDAALSRQLTDVGERLGLPLSTGAVQLAGFRLKRAQTFRYDDEPLAQIAYLDGNAPTALCIIARAGAPAAVATEERRGMNVAFWGNATHQFMLIGRRPMAEMQGLAATLLPRLGVQA